MTDKTTQDLPADEKTIELSRRLGEARSNSKQWGEVAEYLRDELIEHAKEIAAAHGVDEPKALVASGVKVATITTSVRKTLDVDRLKSDYPDIDWDKYYKVSSSTMVRTGKIAS